MANNNVAKPPYGRKSSGKGDLKETSDGSQHKAAQTDTLHVRHVGVQLDPPSSGGEDITSVQSPSSRDVEQTIRKTSDQSVQSQEESSGGQDNQLVTGSNLNVVGSHGPVQLGTGSTVVNPTYKNCNFHHHHHHYHPPPGHPAYKDYLRWVEQNAAALTPGRSYPELISHAQHSPETLPSPECRGNSQNVPRVPHSHHIDQIQMAERLTPAAQGYGFTHPGLPPSSFPQGGNRTELNQTPQAVNQTPYFHHREDTIKKQIPPPSSKHPRSCMAQRNVPQLLPQQTEERIVETTNRRKGLTGRQHTQAQTRPVPDDVIRDTVRIIDSEGRVLEPGDVVYAGSSFAVYIGGQQIVTCVGSRPNLMVKEETLNLTSPFEKLTAVSGQCPVFPPGQRVERAKGKIGSLFTEGNSEDGWDFLHWVFTGLGGYQAYWKGFILY